MRLSRADNSIALPAKCLLVVAANPCPCGFLGSVQACRCSTSQIDRYRARLSGPILDRIDIHMNVFQASYTEMVSGTHSGTSVDMQRRVLNARERRADRHKWEAKKRKASGGHGTSLLHDGIAQGAQKLLRQVYETMHLSARAYLKTVQVCRTIADLEDSDDINEDHVAEALQYRFMDRSDKP